jgi:DNA-directed RNA polymerase specialized sigma24 family protein
VDDFGEGESAVTDSEIALSAARRFKPVGILDGKDYRVIARLAVWRAHRRWRRNGGARWATFAWKAAYGAIQHAIRDTSGVPAWAWDQGARVETLPLEPEWDGVNGHREWQPEAAYLDRETMARAEGLLAPVQRECIAGLMAGKSQSEIARERGVSLAAVSGAVRVGRERLCESCLLD